MLENKKKSNEKKSQVKKLFYYFIYQNRTFSYIFTTGFVKSILLARFICKKYGFRIAVGVNANMKYNISNSRNKFLKTLWRIMLLYNVLKITLKIMQQI